MKIKKIIIVPLIAFLLVLSGCQTRMSYTFNIETGEQIKVKLNTTQGQKLLQSDGRFSVNDKNQNVQTNGIFILPDIFNEFFETIKLEQHSQILEESENDRYKYIFYKVNDESEWIYLIQPKHCKTGIILINTTSQESAKEVFDLLEFELQ